MLPERTFTNPAMRRKQSAGRCRILLRKRKHRAGVQQTQALGNRAGVIFEKGNSCGRGTEGRGRKLQKRVQSKPPLTGDDAEIWIESSAVAFQYQSIISPWRRQHSAQNRGATRQPCGKTAGRPQAGAAGGAGASPPRPPADASAPPWKSCPPPPYAAARAMRQYPTPGSYTLPSTALRMR